MLCFGLHEKQLSVIRHDYLHAACLDQHESPASIVTLNRIIIELLAVCCWHCFFFSDNTFSGFGSLKQTFGSRNAPDQVFCCWQIAFSVRCTTCLYFIAVHIHTHTQTSFVCVCLVFWSYFSALRKLYMPTHRHAHMKPECNQWTYVLRWLSGGGQRCLCLANASMGTTRQLFFSELTRYLEEEAKRSSWLLFGCGLGLWVCLLSHWVSCH